MSKLTKLIFRPRQFFADAIAKRLPEWMSERTDRTKRKRLQETALIRASAFRLTGKPTAILVGFSDWKTFMVDYLSDYNVVFLGHSPKVSKDMIETISCYPMPTVYAWSYKYPEYLADYCRAHEIDLIMVEDGFVRGVGLGVKKTKPLSLVFDRSAMHFDREKPSDLERLLATYDFDADPGLMEQAKQLLEILSSNSITKYNGLSSGATDIEEFLDPERPERILVLGQVEDDLSIKHGMPSPFSCNDLVRIAAIENPNAQILYRPHPEVAVVSKPHYSNPKDVGDICQVLPRSLALHDCIRASTKVYTMTSLAGFEAVLAGKPVKVFGNPFYSGWGFTEDVRPLERRKRKLTPLQVLAGAYILYPRYYHPITSERVGAIDAAEMVASLIQHREATAKFKQLRATRPRSNETMDAQALLPYPASRVNESLSDATQQIAAE